MDTRIWTPSRAELIPKCKCKEVKRGNHTNKEENNETGRRVKQINGVLW